jgi:hypothetical protein
LNDRDTGAEAAVTSQDFIHSGKLGDSSRSLGRNHTVPAVGEVLRRDRQEAMDEPWQTLIGLLGQTLLAEASNQAYLNPGWWTL